MSKVKLGRTPRRYQKLIINALQHGLSNALSEATNTHIRGLTKRAYGFHTPRRAAQRGHAHPRRVLPTAARTSVINYPDYGRRS